MSETEWGPPGCSLEKGVSHGSFMLPFRGRVDHGRDIGAGSENCDCGPSPQSVLQSGAK